MVLKYLEGFDLSNDAMFHRYQERIELTQASKAANGSRVLSELVVERAKAFIDILPPSLPAAKVKGLADGTVMFYWSKTNIAGFDNYDRLELHVEISPTGRITFNWNVLPARGNHFSTFGCGSGSVRADSHVARFLETSAHHALQAFAPLVVIPMQGIETRDEQ